MEPGLLRTSGTLTSVLGDSLITYGYRTHANKTGVESGTRTHDFTDLQSATLAALSSLHKLAVSEGFEPSALITEDGTLAGC